MKKYITLMIVLIAVLLLFSITASAAKNPVLMYVDGFNEREVLSIDYGISQSVDRYGNPTGIPRSNTIVIRVKNLSDYNSELFTWMIDARLKKNVKIVINEKVTGTAMETIYLTDAYCVGYTEHWAEGESYYEEIVLSARKIQNSNITYENEWK